jgi:hypothetical protein
MSAKVPSFQDARDLLDAAERHATAWASRETTTPDAEAEAWQHLAQSVGVLERLATAVDQLRGPLASELVAHQTDNADALGEFFGTVVGDREYGFNPDAKPAGAS